MLQWHLKNLFSMNSSTNRSVPHTVNKCENWSVAILHINASLYFHIILAGEKKTYRESWPGAATCWDFCYYKPIQLLKATGFGLVFLTILPLIENRLLGLGKRFFENIKVFCIWHFFRICFIGYVIILF